MSKENLTSFVAKTFARGKVLAFSNNLIAEIDSGEPITRQTVSKLYQAAIDEIEVEKFDFYESEIPVITKETVEAFEEKWKKLTGERFTTDHARKVLLEKAELALNEEIFSESAEEFKKQFHKILKILPYNFLPDIAALIRTEISIHLRLSYNDAAAEWLFDTKFDNLAC